MTDISKKLVRLVALDQAMVRAANDAVKLENQKRQFWWQFSDKQQIELDALKFIAEELREERNAVAEELNQLAVELSKNREAGT